MTSRIKELCKYLNIIKNDANFAVDLVNDCVDKWFVKFIYPDDKSIHLNFQFSLTENLPPKITVLFPKSLSYICYQELGGATWSSQTDLIIMLYSLYNECCKQSCKYSETCVQTETEAENKWQFVRQSHTDWNYVDITERTKSLKQYEIDNYRKEGVSLLKNETPVTASELATPVATEPITSQ